MSKQEVLSPNLKNYNNWEKQWVHEFNKEGQETVYVRCEYGYYGEQITGWQFGDEPKDLPVRHKYATEVYPFCSCTASESLCGERPFEKDSVVYEFLWKPLSLDLKYTKKGSPIIFTDYEAFRKTMIASGWSHTKG